MIERFFQYCWAVSALAGVSDSDGKSVGDASTVVTGAQSAHWLEVVYWATNSFMPFIAVVAIWLTIRQLEMIKAANQGTERIAKAAFLFMLDELYEGPIFSKSRKLFIDLLGEVEVEIKANCGYLPANERRVRKHEMFSQKLHQKKTDQNSQYIMIMKLCSFFETLGLFVKNGYVTQEEAIDLYGTAIVMTFNLCKTHIDSRREEDGGTNKTYMENFEFLARRAIEIRGDTP